MDADVVTSPLTSLSFIGQICR